MNKPAHLEEYKQLQYCVDYFKSDFWNLLLYKIIYFTMFFSWLKTYKGIIWVFDLQNVQYLGEHDILKGGYN